MITLLSHYFIRNNKEYENPEVRRAYGLLTAFVGIALNVLLFLTKYVIGIVSGSVSIMAEAFNNLSDAGSSVMTLLGFHFAGKKPDPEHPFGHGRIEYVSGLGVSALIIIMGVELFQSACYKIKNPQDMEISTVTMVILLGSILVKIYMYVYNSSVAGKINSASMRATATDSLSDCISTIIVLVSMLIYQLIHINLDGWTGLMVAGFILYAGFSSAKDTISPLLGEAPNSEFVKNIERAVLSHEMVAGIHDMIVHDYGPGRRMVSLHAEVPGNLDIYTIHDEIDLIERELKNRFHCEVVIHMDPIETDNAKVMTLRKEVEKLVKDMDESLSIHDFRMVEGPTHTNLIFDVVVPQGYELGDEDISREITEKVEQKWENCYAVIKMEKKYT